MATTLRFSITTYAQIMVARNLNLSLSRSWLVACQTKQDQLDRCCPDLSRLQLFGEHVIRNTQGETSRLILRESTAYTCSELVFIGDNITDYQGRNIGGAVLGRG